MKIKNFKTRKEIPSEYKWKIEDLYSSDEQWKEDFEQIEKLLNQVDFYKENIVNTSDSLLAYLNWKDEISKKLEKVYVYANQKYHENTKNSIYQSLSNQAENLMIKVNSTLSFD